MMEDHKVITAMHRYGGSFARALANLFERADPDNQHRIKEAFPSLWTEYERIAKEADANKGPSAF